MLGSVEKLEKSTKEKNDGLRKAFIFTTDAFLVLPLVILVISAFVSFSVTIKETVVMQEYAYLISRDSLQYLSAITATEAGIGSSNRSALEYVAVQVSNGDISGANHSIALALDRAVPATAGYSFEYLDESGTWNVVRQGGNIAKFSNPKFQVTSTKVVTALTDPQAPQFTSCATSIECTSPPATRYVAGRIFGPTFMRIRIYI